MPEGSVAERLGLSIGALRIWKGKQQLDVYMFGADACPYGGRSTAGLVEEFWLLGDHHKPTAKSLGMQFTCKSQRHVVGVLQGSIDAVRFGVYGSVCAESAVSDWESIVDLCYDNSDVFHMTSLIDAVHAGKTRPADIEAHLVDILKEMLRDGIFSLNRSSSPEPMRAPHAPPVASEPAAKLIAPDQPRPKVSFFDTSGAKGKRHASIQTEISYGFLHEMMVSQTNMGRVLEGILSIWGFDLIDKPPTRRFSAEILKAGSVLAKGMMGLQIMNEAAHPQDSTASFDGVSIGEYKGIGCAITKRLDMPPLIDARGEVQHRQFTSLRTGLTRLSSGSDITKMRAIKENLTFLVDATNAIHAGENGFNSMQMFHCALVIGATVNDHAESVVANKAVPFLQGLLNDREAATFAEFRCVPRACAWDPEGRRTALDTARKRAIATIVCLNKPGLLHMIACSGDEIDSLPMTVWKKPALVDF